MGKVGIQKVSIQSDQLRGVCTRFGAEMSYGCENRQPVTVRAMRRDTSTSGDTQKGAR